MFIDLSSNRDKTREKNLAIYKQLAEKYSGQAVQFIGIGFEMDRRNAVMLSKKYFDKHAINFPYINGDQEILEKAKGIKGFPTLLIIDGKGRVRSALTGRIPMVTVESFIELYQTDRLSQPPQEKEETKDESEDKGTSEGGGTENTEKSDG